MAAKKLSRKYLREVEKSQAMVTRAFTNCAEAQAYIEVISRGGKAKDYRITAFTPAGDVNPPCANCSLWVYETFGEVVDH